MSNDLIFYSTEDGQAQFTLHQMQGQVWLTQLEMAGLYQTNKQNIGKAEEAVVNQKLTTASDGKDYLTHLSLGLLR